jgi:hypothetical protein
VGSCEFSCEPILCVEPGRSDRRLVCLAVPSISDGDVPPTAVHDSEWWFQESHFVSTSACSCSNLLYVGHTSQDRRQRQDSMVEDVYYRILRAYASIRRCKHAIVRFATCVGSEREGKSSLPLCHVHHM